MPKVKMRNQEILDKEISYIHLRVKNLIDKQYFSNHDKLYVFSLVGTELIGSAMCAVSEEMIGKYLDDIIGMIKTKIRNNHEAFKVIKETCEEVFNEEKN